MKLIDINKTMLEHLTFDDAFFKKIAQFKGEIITNNAEFLMGGTIGEQDVKFTIVHEEYFFNNIFKVDPKKYRSLLLENENIEPNFRTQLNVKYNILVYLIHLLLTKKAKVKEPEKSIQDVNFLFFFIKASSKLTHDFGGATSYKPTPEIAHSTLESLSKKFLTKQHGSWMGVSIHFGNSYLSGGGYHRPITNFKDKEVLDVIVMMTTRINSVFKTQFNAMVELLRDGTIIKSGSIFDEFDGEKSLKDINSETGQHKTFIKKIVNIKADFIIDDLALYLSELVSVPNKTFRRILVTFSDKYLEIEDRDDIIDFPIRYAITFIKDSNYDLKRDDLGEVIKKLFFKYSSGKARNTSMSDERQKIEKFLDEYGIAPKRSRLSSAITGFQMYIFIRALLGKKD